MVITNHMIGECYTQLSDSDDAVVGFRRAINENPDFVPSYVGAIRELEKMNNMDEAARLREELAALAPEGYMQTMDQHPQGILAVIMSDYPPPVEEIGDAFRKRKDKKSHIHSWVVASDELYSREPGAKLDFFTADRALHASLADHTLTHFKDQGGETGQVARKLIQTGISAIKETLFGVGTDSSADMRYWSTIPGDVFAMYMPLETGLHTVRAFAYNEDHAGMHEYKQLWHYIPVREEQTTALVLISHDKMFDPNKADKAPPPLACCDASGHNPANIPFILGGDCFCTPSRRLLEAMHAAGHHTDVDYAALKKLYDNADIVTSQDHRGCNNLCEWGPHVAFGGKCMSCPTPGTCNYESVMTWKRSSAETLELGEVKKTKQSDNNESSHSEALSGAGETPVENE